MDCSRELEISNDAYAKLLKYVQKDSMNENGGILLGKVTDDYFRVTITNITEPTLFDKKGRYHFIRSKRSVQKTINKLWKLSDREINYIGEWHTHPQENPKPSLTDEIMIAECIKNNTCPFGELFLIIIGLNDTHYVGHRTQKSLTELYLKEE